MAKKNTIEEILKLHELKTPDKEIARYLNVDETYVIAAIENAHPKSQETSDEKR